jgi:flagellin-like protein|tara:strand:+ start:1449 stop:1877 length:429 start_codon:yes stop_codon:yes gene_type:complete
MDKRGISGVIVTVLLVALVLVVGGVAWVAFSKVVGDASEEINIGRVSLDLEIISAFADGNNLIVNVQRKKGNGELVGIKFLVDSEDDQEILEESVSLDQFDSEKFTLSLSSIDPNQIIRVSIAPVLDSGTADIKDVYEIKVG